MKRWNKFLKLPQVNGLLLLLLLLVCVLGSSHSAKAASTLKLTAGCKYVLADDAGVVWKSSKPSVAKIVGKNKVKVLRTGRTKLTGTVDGEEKYSYTVKAIKFKPVKMTRLKCYSQYRRYMTTAEFKKAYTAACKVVKPYAGFEKKEQLQAIARELRYIFERYGSYSMTKKHYNDPYGYLVSHVASCAGCARDGIVSEHPGN